MLQLVNCIVLAYQHYLFGFAAGLVANVLVFKGEGLDGISIFISCALFLALLQALRQTHASFVRKFGWSQRLSVGIAQVLMPPVVLRDEGWSSCRHRQLCFLRPHDSPIN